MTLGSKTLREITGQPKVWRQCLETLDSLDITHLIGKAAGASAREWLFIGCGTSYYLAQAAAATFQLLGAANARAVPASEVLLFPLLALQAHRDRPFPILISRSGTTSEVIQAAEYFHREGIEFLAITCDGNELESISSRSLKLPVVEESTVMTSSFTSMLIALQYVAATLSGNAEVVKGLHSLPDTLEHLIEAYDEKVREFAKRDFDNASFLAQGALFPIASETALKVMESSSSYAESFHSFEFRHGPKSIVNKHALVGALLSETAFEEEFKVLREMKDLGAQTLAIANAFPRGCSGVADLEIKLGSVAPEPARLSLYVVWGQLLGSYMGVRKGLDPDSPQNLTRAVTLGD